MVEVTLVFPDQLFQNHPAIERGRGICLAEEFLFFKVQSCHKQRLVLLKTAMREFANKLTENNHKVLYFSSKQLNQRGDLFTLLAKKGVKAIHVAEFSDEWLRQDLEAASLKHGIQIYTYPSPGFFCSEKELRTYFAGKKRYSMAQFYAYQRQKLQILMNGSKPLGGRYSFDSENRKKIPKGTPVPRQYIPKLDQSIENIIHEVETEFPHYIGKAFPFIYPSNHLQARHALEVFLKEKFAFFGDFQDAMQKEDSFLFHSVLAPLLNVGLLTPGEVISTSLEYAKKYSVPMNSLEGFIRQVIGWREFVRASYLFKGSSQRSLNFFDHHNHIPKAFWNGKTGIFPIDNLIKRIQETGYCNHIERLMVLGNFLLLTETSPRKVYEWFMGHFVDAYDWVMVPNTYGMSQYADGGSMVTKPYISGSNYLLKLSNYPKGEWTEIWDGLFWRFIQRHQELFFANPRTRPMTQLLSKKASTLIPKIETAEGWLLNYLKAS